MFAFMARHRGIWPLKTICEALGVSRSGFYGWLTRPASERAKKHAALVAEIGKSFLASDRTYGARRVWRDVLDAGLSCGLHTIERLMKKNALRARPKRRRLPTDTGQRPPHELAANVLDRQFEAPAPNRKWVADFTYIWTAEGWLYVAVVLDLFSRRIVGWSMSAAMTAELVTDALMMAVWRRRRPRELLHHSDRGSPYTSEHCQRLMAEHGIRCSLKTDRTAGKTSRSRDAARADVFDYINRFYNPRRRHSTSDT